MKEIKVVGYDYCNIRLREGQLRGTMFFSDLEKYNEPVYVKSQYGWRTGCEDTDFKKIYPPFKIIKYRIGDEYTLSVWDIECGDYEEITL